MDGEPALGTENHHCAHMSILTNDEHRWKIADCYSKFRYICESIPYSSKDFESDHSLGYENIKNTNQGVSNKFKYRNSIYEISEVKVRLSYILIENCNLI